MLLRRDGTIQLYGLQSFSALFPWDPLSLDFPERVAPLLEKEFLSQWAGTNGDTTSPRAGAADVVVIPEASPSDRRAKPGTAATARRLANAKARVTTSQQQLEEIEAELRAASDRRRGFDEWARIAEEQLALAKARFDDAVASARAQEAELGEIRRGMEEAKEAVELTGTDAQAARGRLQAAGRSIRVARSVRQMRKTGDALAARVAAVEEARRREQALAEELAGRQSVLDRALLKAAEAIKAESAVRRQVTNARRKAARASLALSNLMEQVRGAGQPPEGSDEGAPLVTDVEQAEKEVQAARTDMLGAAEELRSIKAFVEAYQEAARTAQRAFLEAEAEERNARALVGSVEAEIAEAEDQARDAEPSLVDAQADAHAVGSRVVGAGRSLRAGRHTWRLGRARRRARALASRLAEARRDAEGCGARLDDATRAWQEAEDRVAQGRAVESEARKSLIEARRRHGVAVGVLSHLRSVSGEDAQGSEEPFRFVVIGRDRAVLGSLSFDEWAGRATGHGRAPRFILEVNGEALWLYRGEWIVADPSLTLDDLAVLEEESSGELELQEVEIPGDRTQRHELETIRFVWERCGGRCANCGSVANLEIDHIVPVYFGGSDAASNLQLLCRNCVREKSHQL